MSKILFGVLCTTLAWVSVHAYALQSAPYPQFAWVCTYQPLEAHVQQDPAINKGLPLSEVLQINFGIQKVVSQGTMSCASPLLPTPVLYKNVAAVSEMFTAGANVGLRPSLLQASLQIDAGVSTAPQGMFKKFSAVLTGNGNVLLSRISAGGGINASNGSLSGTGILGATVPTPSIGGDVQIGTIELYNVTAHLKRRHL